MQNATPATGEALPVSRRAMLGNSAALAATAIVLPGAAVGAAMGPKGESIAQLFADWLAACEACDTAVGQEAGERAYAECERLQGRITAMEPVTARDAAMQFVVETHDNGCEYRETFYRRVRRLAMEG